ncbi:hypothetical protein PSN45_000969 [Yamadazyma tenuis]|uniref:Uncharacterized protein n=1 Tax=Candida tenuis (strain ATCC 10573 / BCRC 21748 / CBS 615 / JCM 9827 / NBRC 10315 / NRRL Y-1498 / VKM Y-70) TaxID=590646 RepID=G3B7D4_CANTC|nr:uncharacterized protein CANTEDRAFT_115709 [Yamadazyma tenuis ATCC 10573]XP_006689000.1 uncharacterized protein CANTEDRAFT_115709 [Yamadazyma tenuis ATCC 10573]EGV62829.1 hypothetical protein CANTEDRAFT_115709 [Yamadazyma tenuis ATCC 10573]EGV62830.1 hypothetical protein CANTEDRAFT_115709 [Yamadazyma tenuis ATCC 10573]WEJ93504.1 hypothetical protein PSN45_000969 [Yamadazyma tenuis]
MRFDFLLCLGSVFITAQSLVVRDAPQDIVPLSIEDAVPGKDLYQSFQDALTEEQLDIIEELQDSLQASLFEDDNVYEYDKRDLESTIESVINLVNSSGVVWTALDYAADHPSLISYLANTTASLIDKGADANVSGIVSVVAGAASNLNLTALSSLVSQSGLIQSTLDGLLLEEKYRKDISKIIYNVVEKNIDLITLIARELLAPANSNSKRAESSSLLDFVGNIAGSFLNSKILYNGLGEVLNALNDTGFVVYTAQRFIDTPAYVNMTGDLISEVLSKSDISLSSLTSSINITALVSSALSDPAAITAIIGKVLKGDYSGLTSGLSSFAKRYKPAITGIISDLEDLGLFKDLNNAIFPSTTGSSNNKEVVATEVANSTSSTSSSIPLATTSESGTGGFVMNTLLVAQAFFAVVFFM